MIPCLNSPLVGDVADEASRQAASFCAQWEIVVVGRDEPDALARRSLVRFVETPRPVYSGAARNLGLKEARGEQVVFVDADCIPQPGWLETLLRHQAEHDCVASGAIELEDTDYWRLCGNVAEFRENLSSRPPARRTYLASFSLVGSRAAFVESGGFDETLRTGQDLELTARLHQQGVPLCFEPRARVVHRPSRKTFGTLPAYAFLCGSNSIRVRARHPQAMPTPRLAFNWVALLALSPLIAAVSTWRTFADDPAVRRRWRTAPVVFLMKMGWVFGASQTLRREGSHLLAGRPKLAVEPVSPKSSGRSES